MVEESAGKRVVRAIREDFRGRKEVEFRVTEKRRRGRPREFDSMALNDLQPYARPKPGSMHVNCLHCKD